MKRSLDLLPARELSCVAPFSSLTDASLCGNVPQELSLCLILLDLKVKAGDISHLEVGTDSEVTHNQELHRVSRIVANVRGSVLYPSNA